MKWFNNQRVSSKLIIAFAIVFIITAVIGAMSLASLSQLKQTALDTFDVRVK